MLSNEKDVLDNLLWLPRQLLLNKFHKIITILMFSFVFVIFLLSFLMLLETKDLELYAQYLPFSVGSFISICSYLTVVFQRHTFHSIRDEVFPYLWSLHSVGHVHFIKLQKLEIVAKYLLIVSSILVVLTATFGLPWFGDESEFYYPVRLATDYLGGWRYLFFVMFYLALYHGGLIINCNVLTVTYLLLHLYIQCYLLNQNLKTFTKDLKKMKSDRNTHKYIHEKLKICVQQHQIILMYSKRIIDLIYFPIFFFTLSGIFIGVSIIFVWEYNFKLLLRAWLVVIDALTVTLLLCSLGQLVENKSEEIVYIIYDLPWYSWSLTNQKSVLIFLTKSNEILELSSSGLITINNTLLIRLYRNIYSMVMFAMNLFSVHSN